MNRLNNYGTVRENSCDIENIALYCEPNQLKNVVFKGLDNVIFCFTTKTEEAAYFLMGNCFMNGVLIPPMKGFQLDAKATGTCDGFTPPEMIANPCGFAGKPLVLRP